MREGGPGPEHHSNAKTEKSKAHTPSSSGEPIGAMATGLTEALIMPAADVAFKISEEPARLGGVLEGGGGGHKNSGHKTKKGGKKTH